MSSDRSSSNGYYYYPTLPSSLSSSSSYQPSVVLQATCLKPHYNLRRQLLISFGATSVLGIVAVLALAISAARHAGEIVKDQAHDSIRQQVLQNLQHKSMHIADIMTRKLNNLGATAALMAEVTRDRIVGYPQVVFNHNMNNSNKNNNNSNRDDTEQFVPFYDSTQQRNIYPLQGQNIPLLWNITINVNESNYMEHVQERWKWYNGTQVSTVSAGYGFQGTCNPKATNPNSTYYAVNCSNERNNNIANGGILRPTRTNQYLHQASSDLGLFIKPLWEAVPEAYSMGIYFANSGAGSFLLYPPKLHPTPGMYTSTGCDWMLTTINNYTGRPLATPEEVALCHPNGTSVVELEYNVLERPWCQQQAMHPNQTISYGPYLNVGEGILWLVTVGRAVFDRMTGEFIACTLIDVAVQELVDVFTGIITSSTGSFSTVSLVDWYTGMVVAGPFWNVRNATSTISITETGLIDQQHFDQIKSLLNFSQPWDPDVVRNVQVVDHGDESVVTAYPVPVPPKTYDPNYSPKYMVLFRVEASVFHPIDNIQHSIDNDVFKFTLTTIVVGVAFGFILVLMLIWLLVRILTKPLLWMHAVAWGIVNHTDERVTTEDLLHQNFSSHRTTTSNTLSNRSGGGSVSSTGSRSLIDDRCTPNTEITALVSEFRTMIHGFSREGAASVAPCVVNEISNQIQWQDEFIQLYTKKSRRSSFIDTGESFALSAAAATAAAAVAAAEVDDEGDDSVETSSDDVVPTTTTSNKLKDDIRWCQNELMVNDDIHGLGDCSPNVMMPGIGDVLPERPLPRPTFKINKEHCLPPLLIEENQLRRYLKTDLNADRIRVYRSPLFRWILLSFIFPLTISYAIIYTLARNQVIHVLPTWLAHAESVSLTIQVDTVMSAASLRAELIEAIMNGVARDLHLMTRFAGWLLFDGVRRSSGFTDVTEATEQCKNANIANETCPYLLVGNRAPCDCAWDDGHGQTCTIFNTTNSRYLQRRFFAAQAKDANNITGDRNYTTGSKQPEDTEWWNDTGLLPGAHKGVLASGYATVYDRVRVTSALAAVEFPIYNYAGALGKPSNNLGTYVAFGADGLMTGYDGCQYSYADYAHFQSTTQNLAQEIGGKHLCPIGSYGYDPRCRGWFAIGKNVTMQPKSALYVAPPEVLFASQTVASTAASSLLDPSNGDFVGLTVLKFSNRPIYSALEASDVDFSFVITPTTDFTGGDTVVASSIPPGATVPIYQVILPFDSSTDASQNQRDFNNIIANMSAGLSGQSTLQRTTSDGTQETLLLVYGPIRIRTLKAVRPDDIARGVNATFSHVYSLAVASDWNELHNAFKKIEANVINSLTRKGWVYTALICTCYVLLCAVTSFIAISVTKPVIILLRAVRNINAGRIEYDIPPMQGGSREVNQVYNSFAKLYKILRFSNSAFFSGNLTRAFHFINDALDLFRKVDDRKAVGIASNNLGNTLLAMYRENSHKFRPGECCCRVDGVCVVGTARDHLNEAVRIATIEFDQALDDDIKAEYAQQLANRHFNRAMLCLLTQHDPCSSHFDRELAYKDLLRTMQLDRDVREFWMSRMLVLKKSDTYFNRLIRRIRGLVDLYNDDTVRSIWNAKDLVDETDRLLFAAWDEMEAPLFRQISRFGRLQQLEEATIRLEMALNNTVEAARLGMRMFVEDEFLIETSFVTAATATLGFANSSGWAARTMASFKSDLRKMAKTCKKSSFDLGRTFVFCFEFSDCPLRVKIVAKILELFDRCCREDDLVGLVHPSSNKDTGFAIECKRNAWQEQRRKLQKAALKSNEHACSPALSHAAQMVTCAIQECSEIPVFLVAVVDGLSRDTNAFGGLHDQIIRLQRQSRAEVHVIVVGLDLPPHVEEQCTILGKLSRASAYIKVDDETVETAFEQVALLMSFGRGMTTESIHGGITMEKF